MIFGDQAQAILKAVCSNPSGKANPNTLEGITFWFRLYISRSAADVKILSDYTRLSMKNMAKAFDVDTSNFRLFLKSL
jgi:hypothetical protein